MLARLVATVPFKVGTQVFALVVSPASGEQLDAKHAFCSRGEATHVPASAHVPAQVPTAQALPVGFAWFGQPLAGSHSPATWHESDAMQVTG
jgi:hypothetical protein